MQLKKLIMLQLLFFIYGSLYAMSEKKERIQLYFASSAFSSLTYLDDITVHEKNKLSYNKDLNIRTDSEIQQHGIYYYDVDVKIKNEQNIYNLIRQCAEFVAGKHYCIGYNNALESLNSIQRNPIASIISSFTLGASLVGFVWWWKSRH